MVGWMVEHEGLLAEQLSVGGRGACGFGGHEDGAVGGDGGSEACCMHWHVGAVRCSQSVVRAACVEWHHRFAIHELLHGQLVSLLRSSPLCSPVLEPNLYREKEEGQ